MFEPKLYLEQSLSNQQLMNTFKVGPEGGMRRSLTTGSLVLISNHTTKFYEDVWKGNVFHYTGMGKQGDQSIDFAQNKTLRDRDTNAVRLFLFEVFEKGNYVYRGRVVLAAEPYTKTQKDFEGNERTVWIFPLKAIDKPGPKVIDEKVFEEDQKEIERQASVLSDEELMKRIVAAKKDKKSESVLSSRYVRNPFVAEAAKRRAKGKCQLCSKEAPFRDKSGSAYLESHHLIWLSKAGSDSLDNTVALCPNCHRKMHVLDLESDKKTLTNSLTKGFLGK